jgi:RhtB (resistance to homoserine/threonine) family protein
MHLLPFLAISAIVVITPGVDMAVVTKNALLHGPRQALASAFGINLGIAFWTVAAALGLAALIAASAAAFTVVKLVGAVYLVYLGMHALRASRSGQVQVEMPRAGLSVRAAFRQGLVSNLLNPKIAVFFTSLLPQFVDRHGAAASQLLILGALFNVLGIVWLVSYATIAARGRNLLTRPSVKRGLDRLSGAVLIGLGARLAFESRR